MELHFVSADDRGGLLESDVELKPFGQDVAVPLPPARGPGLPCQNQELLPFRLVGDPVQGEQVGHVALPGGAATAFQTADLGMGRPDDLGSLRGCEAS